MVKQGNGGNGWPVVHQTGDFSGKVKAAENRGVRQMPFDERIEFLKGVKENVNQ